MTAKFHVKRIVRVKMATEKEKKNAKKTLNPQTARCSSFVASKNTTEINLTNKQPKLLTQ